jgi:protein-disulfide isomerase
MKRALLALALLVTSAASAQSLDPNAGLKSYAAKILPRCPNATLTLEPSTTAAPPAFRSFVVTQRSATDQTCGGQRQLLHSSKTQQVLIGSLIPLASDARPANVRIAEEATRLIGKKVTATVSPFPLGDGLKAVSILRDTPYGPFSYNGFIDGSERFLIVGFRGSLTSDPVKTLRDALGTSAGARRGNAAAKTEILEISDFQCPTCARAHERIEPLIQKNLDKISYVRIDLPLFEHHEWAMQASMGARALQKVAPGKYWQYVDYIFKNQEAIGKRKFDDVIRDWADDNDVDWAAMQKIYGSTVERKALLDQVSRAFAIGVASTPTFIINGQIMGFGPDGQYTIDAIKNAVGAPAPAPAKKKTK